MNEKIKELINWCQEEIDFCIDIMNSEHGYNSYHTHRAEAKKQVFDAVKDKLCSIYDEATNEGDLAYCDDFLCSKCGIHLTDWVRMDVKEDDRYEYEFKFCPNCGAKIVNHD